MNKNLFCGIIFVLFAVFMFAGCGGGGGNYITQNDPIEYSTKATQVNSDGTVKISTVSNLILEAKEENTFDKDVFIQIKEKDSLTPQSKYFSNASRIYSIKAEKSYKDALGVERKTSVTTINNPVLITIPNTIHRDGTYFLGFRGNTDDVWNYSAINSENSRSNPMVLSSRLSLNNNSSEFIVSTYNVAMQFMLFLIPSDTPLNKTSISDFAVKMEPSEIKTDEGVYLEDLKMIIDFTGDKLNGLKPDDVTIVIDFLNNDSTEYSKNTIPVTGATLNTSRSLNDAGAGNRYVHTMSLSSITDFSTNSLSFKLGLKKVSMEMFPKSFNVTFKTRGSDEILPYSRTRNIELIEAQKPETRYIHAMLKNPAEGSFIASTTTTLQIQMPEEIKWSAACEKLVTVRTDNASDTSAQYSYSYANSLLTIKRQSDFISEASYTVSIGEGIKAVADYTELASASFSFSTISDRPYVPVIPYVRVASIVPLDKAENVATSTSIVLTFDGDIIWTADSEKKITLSTGKETVASSYEYSDRVLTITHKGLAYSKLYTLNVADGLVASDSEAVVASCSFCFMTEKQPDAKVINVVKTSPQNSSTDVATNTPIMMTFDGDIVWTAESEKKVILRVGSETVACHYEYSDRVLALTHDGLNYNKLYTVDVMEGLTASSSDIIVASCSFYFMTAPQPDTKLINIAETTPKNGDINVATDTASVITITFDKELDSNTEWDKFVTISNGSATIPLTFDYSGKTLNIHHSGLENNTTYIVMIDGGMKGTEPFSESQPKVFSFTTAIPETIFVTAVMTTPDVTSEVSVSSQIVVTFSDEIIWSDECKSLVVLSVDENPVDCVYSYADKILTLQPVTSLLYDKMYTLIVSEELRPLGIYNKMKIEKSFAFNTLRQEVTPQITGDSEKARNNMYYLVPGQEFTVNFNKPVCNVSTAKSRITMKKGSEAFSGFTISDFNSDNTTTIITVTDALEAGCVYSVSVEGYTDENNSKIASVTADFNALPDIEVVSSSIASGAIDIPIDGSIVVEFSEAVATDAVKLVDNEGNEITTGVVCVTTEKAATIEMTYTDLRYPATYGLLMEYTDNVTGQSLVRQIHTFSTGMPERPFLLNPEAENSPDNPYLIYTAKALDKVRNELSAHYKQMADIDISKIISDPDNPASGWLPIGTTSVPFSGSYNGNGYKIANLNIARFESDYCGLFRSFSGTMNDVTIEKSVIYANNTSGALIGEMKNGTIQNCTVSNNKIQGMGGNIGGLIGIMRAGTIKDCNITTDDVSGNGYYVGGFIGELSSGNIENCTITGGSVSANGVADYAGGFLGHSNGAGSSYITDCSVSLDGITAYQIAGGFAGESYALTIDKCFAEISYVNFTYTNYDGVMMTFGGLIGKAYNGSVASCSSYIAGFSCNGGYPYDSSCGLGGLIGYCSSMTVSDCRMEDNDMGFLFSYVPDNYSVGGLIGSCCDNTIVENCSVDVDFSNLQGYSVRVGGIVGYSSDSSITNCSSYMANVSYISDSYVGGIMGYANYGSSVYINRCSAKLSSYSSSYGYYGGILGYSDAGDVNISECFADCDMQGIYFGGGIVGYMYSYNSGYYATIRDCYATGNITGYSSTYSSNYLGGLIGECYAYYGTVNISNSYSTCSINFSASSYSYAYRYCGALAGYNYKGLSMYNCFTTQTMKADGSASLPIVGKESSSSYYDTYSSPDGYLAYERESYGLEPWDSTIWDGLDTPTPKLKNVGGQE